MLRAYRDLRFFIHIRRMNNQSSSLLRALLAVVLFALTVFLRFFQLAQLPPAPYWEEVALAYDAYSIVQTGRDHHGTAWPLVAFESFGDWKPSGYFYAAAAAIKLFDLSVWSVRLPAALAGSCFVLLMGLSGWLAHRYWNIGTHTIWLALLGIAAISPWGILFSRAAWEVMLATTFGLAAILCFWWFLSSWLARTSWQWPALFLSLLSAALSMYTYHALRLVTPLLMLWTLLWWLWQTQRELIWQTWSARRRSTLATLCVGLIFISTLLLPILLNLTSPVVRQRFAETSIFNSPEPVELSNAARAAAGDGLVARVLHHRYWYTFELIAQQYLKHLSLDFLFLHGDSNPRHSSQYFGQLYYLDAVFIILGWLFLWRKHRNWAVYLLGWWLISTTPAALTTAAPHALRSLPTLFVWLWLIGLGVGAFTQRSRWFGASIVVGYAVSLAWFWSAYTLQYPKTYAAEWQSGYCEMYQALEQARQLHPELPVYVTRVQGRPAMYYWFCQKIDPTAVQAANAITQQDQSEFLDYAQLKFVTGVASVPTISALVAAEANETPPTTPLRLLYQSSSWQIWLQ